MLRDRLNQLERKLDRVVASSRLNTALLLILNRKAAHLMATLADLQAAVTAEDTIIDSAIALLNGLAAQIAALEPNQAAIDALAADVAGKTQALADAVTANTPPAAPAPAPAP